MVHNLGNELARWLNKARFQVFIRLVRLVNGARAEDQRRAERLDKRRFGTVVHHLRFDAEQFFHHFH